MQITVNGESLFVEAPLSIEGLLNLRHIHSQRIAVMVNDSVVKKVQYAAEQLAEGDRVEIVQMVGGG